MLNISLINVISICYNDTQFLLHPCIKLMFYNIIQTIFHKIVIDYKHYGKKL